MSRLKPMAFGWHSDGIRCAPFAWRTPPSWRSGVRGPCGHADSDARLWFASTDALILRKMANGEESNGPRVSKRSFNRPMGLSTARRESRSARTIGLWSSIRGLDNFEMPTSAKRKVRFVGAHKDRSVWAQTMPAARRDEGNGLEQFDGEKFVSWIEPTDWT